MFHGARSPRQLGLPLALLMVLSVLVSQAAPADAQGGCGGFQGFNFGGGQFQGGSFQGGFNQGGFNFGGGSFQGGFNQGGINFNGALTGFGFNFGGRPGCGTGVFGLIPDAGTVGSGESFTYRLVWVSPRNWTDLEFLDLRLRRGSQTTLIRWYQATDTFAVIDPLTGQQLSSGQPGSSRTLPADIFAVALKDTYSENSGPTGQAVGLNIAFEFKGDGTGQQIQVDVGAKSFATPVSPYEFAAILTVAARNDPNNDDEDGRNLTEEQRQQRERTNRASLDDYRTEGSAVSASCNDAIPTVMIANRDGNVVLQLFYDARSACELVRPGDYIEAVGEKQHEQLYEVDQLTVRRNGTRVR